jgi:hypothetical protein
VGSRRGEAGDPISADRARRAMSAASIVATVLDRPTGGFFRDGQPIGW